jgi:imidazoleglycerol phosphate dehydratase HisB
MNSQSSDIGPFAQEAVPLDVGIAQVHMGLGVRPGHVLLHEIVNHMVAEFLPDVHDEMVEPQCPRPLSGRR